jgi:hypothetical protein
MMPDEYLFLDEYLLLVDDERQAGLQKFHAEFLPLIEASAGSAKKHQAWPGGYKDHILACLHIAWGIYMRHRPHWNFSFGSVVLVLYFHDLEKIWKYSIGLPENFDKADWYNNVLPNKYGVAFNSDELNALKYVHGEGEDYSEERVMNELAALCHAADVLSARAFHSLREEELRC